jgi:hypothetical protein
VAVRAEQVEPLLLVALAGADEVGVAAYVAVGMPVERSLVMSRIQSMSDSAYWRWPDVARGTERSISPSRS